MPTLLQKYLTLFTAVAVSLVGSAAQAQTPYQCSSTSWTEVPYELQIGVDESSDYPIDPIAGNIGYRRYDNSIKHSRRFIANRWVDRLRIYYDVFQTEPNFDFLRVSGGSCAGGCSIVRELSGDPWAGGGSMMSPDGQAFTQLNNADWSQSLQSTHARIEFESDRSITELGVEISRVEVKCSSSTYNDLTEMISPGDSIDGILLGGGDIAYFALPGGTTPGFHQSLALWGPSDSSHDFDLYLRCGAYPTTSLYDFMMNSGSNQEFIHWSDAERACPTRWYAGVYSYSGRGFFRAFFSRHKEAEHLTWRVGLRPNDCGGSTADDLAAAEQFLTTSSREVFGATDGQVHMDWQLYTVSGNAATPLDESWTCGDKQCNLRLSCKNTGGGQAPLNGDRLWVGTDAWRDHTGFNFLHEFGHAHFGLGDYYYLLNAGPGGTRTPTFQAPWFFPTERNDIIANTCGHSTMANGHMRTTRHRYCTAHNHLRDVRYVQLNYAEDNVLTTNGEFASGANASLNAYNEPFGDTGFVMRDGPPRYLSAYDARSDLQVAIDNGHLWMMPAGSGDPYEFLDFAAYGFPGRVTSL